MAFAQFEAAIDDREQHDPARIGLVRVGQYLPAVAKAIGDRTDIRLGRSSPWQSHRFLRSPVRAR